MWGSEADRATGTRHIGPCWQPPGCRGPRSRPSQPAFGPCSTRLPCPAGSSQAPRALGLGPHCCPAGNSPSCPPVLRLGRIFLVIKTPCPFARDPDSSLNTRCFSSGPLRSQLCSMGHHLRRSPSVSPARGVPRAWQAWAPVRLKERKGKAGPALNREWEMASQRAISRYLLSPTVQEVQLGAWFSLSRR